MPELKLQKDPIWITETLLDTAAEQPVELDYSLPDYYPSIFRLLGTRIRPVIQQTRIAGNRITLDGLCRITVLYQGEDGGGIQAVEQTLPFSRSLELRGESEEEPAVCCQCRCYHASGRAVSPRRLDVRGGVSIRVKVTAQKELPVVTAASGGGVQIHAAPVTLCGRQRFAAKPVTVTEELELPTAKPPFKALLDSRSAVRMEDCRIIANKVICRGELLCHLLYQPEEGEPESMDYSLPISQILDLPGVDGDDEADVRCTAADLTIEAIPGQEGCRRLGAEWTLWLSCTARQNQQMPLADDAFSTRCAGGPERTPVAAARLTGRLDLQHTLKGQLTAEPIGRVMDLLCQPGEMTTRTEGGQLILSGSVEVTALCLDPEGNPFAADRTLPFSVPVEVEGEGELLELPHLQLLETGYTITGDTTLEIRIQMQFSGSLCQRLNLEPVTGIQLDESQPLPPSPCAIRLYFTEPGESLWEIARRFGTSMQAVMTENQLETEQLPGRQMLLIPQVED